MKFICIFDRWYIEPEDRGGASVDDRGMLTLQFIGVSARAIARVNGQLKRLEGENVSLRANEGAYSLTLLFPNGKVQEVEDLTVSKGRLIPSGLCSDKLLLEIAERLQDLEQRVGDDERDIQGIRDKKQGAYFLGGAKQ